MIKLIRANQKTFLAGLTIVSMITFVASYGNKGVGSNANDPVYATVKGKPILASEASQARAEVAALKNEIDFINHEPRSREAQLLQGLIAVAGGQKAEWFLLLRHEAISAGIQVSDDNVNEILNNYTDALDPETDAYAVTRAGVSDALKIIARFDQITAAMKTSQPMIDREMAARFETLQLDCIQFKAEDFADKVTPPTTQQLQAQFTEFAAIDPHHPMPTTNPFGFGYRLPVRAAIAYAIVPHDAITAAVAATKFTFPEPDWDVQAWKYYLAHPEEFIQAPTTATTTATTQPTGPQPFPSVKEKILKNIREPMVTSLSDKVEGYVSSTLSTDWQAYSQFIIAGNAGTEPITSLGVAYTSPDYLPKLAAQVQSKFNVKIITGQSPTDLSQEQIAALPDFGVSTVAQDAMKQAAEYLAAVDKKDPTAPAILCRPSAPITIASKSDGTAFVHLTHVLPSEPAPSLASVKGQVVADVCTRDAYNLALEKAKAITANAKSSPLMIASSLKNPLIHIKDFSMRSDTVAEIKPELGAELNSFKTQAFQLLDTYDPVQNRYPAATIELPQQQRAFAAQLSSLEANWTDSDYFQRTLSVRNAAMNEEDGLIWRMWTDLDAIIKRTDFKLAGKNGSS